MVARQVDGTGPNPRVIELMIVFCMCFLGRRCCASKIRYSARLFQKLHICGRLATCRAVQTCRTATGACETVSYQYTYHSGADTLRPYPCVVIEVCGAASSSLRSVHAVTAHSMATGSRRGAVNYI